MLFAVSCRQTDEYLPLPQQEEDVYYQTVPYSITVGITPMTDKIDGVKQKTTFYEGDIIQITNPQLLTEPAILTSEGCAGMEKATFSGELKVKLGKTLTPGSTMFTASLRNADESLHLYNDGNPFKDIKEIESNEEGLDKYSYWACENFTYNPDATINLEQNTIFVKFDVSFGGANFSLSSNNAFSSEYEIDNDIIYAVPYGMVLKSEEFDYEKTLDEKGKLFYTIKAETPSYCLPGVFSVADNKKCLFSKGNLKVSTLFGVDGNSHEDWYFATHQYDYDYGYFGFGDWLTEGNENLRYDEEYNLIGTCVLGSRWSLLSDKEWYYLLYERTDAEKKHRFVYINDIEGLMLLPDDWTMYDESLAPNEYSEEEWSKMETEGAVFLPCGKSSYGYWTSSFVNTERHDEIQASSLLFSDQIMRIDYTPTNNAGRYARLVYAWNTENITYPTQNVDRCIEVTTEANDTTLFLIRTPKYSKGDSYEISMSVISNVITHISSTTYGENSAHDDWLCSFLSNPSWTSINEKGKFYSDGEWIAFHLYGWFPCRYYFDDISIKINGKEVVFNGDCSTNYHGAYEIQKNTTLATDVTFVDKDFVNMEPAEIGSDVVVAYEDFTSYIEYPYVYSENVLLDKVNGIVSEPMEYGQFILVTNYLELLEGNYSFYVEIKGDQAGSCNVSNMSLELDTNIDFDTEWETKEISFSRAESNQDAVEVNLFECPCTVYIRSVKLVYHGK